MLSSFLRNARKKETYVCNLRNPSYRNEIHQEIHLLHYAACQCKAFLFFVYRSPSPEKLNESNGAAAKSVESNGAVAKSVSRTPEFFRTDAGLQAVHSSMPFTFGSSRVRNKCGRVGSDSGLISSVCLRSGLSFFFLFMHVGFG